MVFHHERLRPRVRQQRQVLRSRQLEVERNEHAARAEHRERRQMPLGLIRHHDGGAVARREPGLRQPRGQR
jgi:hypothetical protein